MNSLTTTAAAIAITAATGTPTSTTTTRGYTQHPYCCSGLATLPSVGANQPLVVPSHSTSVGLD